MIEFKACMVHSTVVSFYFIGGWEKYQFFQRKTAVSYKFLDWCW